MNTSAIYKKFMCFFGGGLFYFSFLYIAGQFCRSSEPISLKYPGNEIFDGQYTDSNKKR